MLTVYCNSCEKLFSYFVPPFRRSRRGGVGAGGGGDHRRHPAAPRPATHPAKCMHPRPCAPALNALPCLPQKNRQKEQRGKTRRKKNRTRQSSLFCGTLVAGWGWLGTRAKRLFFSRLWGLSRWRPRQGQARPNHVRDRPPAPHPGPKGPPCKKTSRCEKAQKPVLATALSHPQPFRCTTANGYEQSVPGACRSVDEPASCAPWRS